MTEVVDIAVAAQQRRDRTGGGKIVERTGHAPLKPHPDRRQDVREQLQKLSIVNVFVLIGIAPVLIAIPLRVSNYGRDHQQERGQQPLRVSHKP